MALQDSPPRLLRRHLAPEKVLGWKPKLSNAEALIRTYDWYLAHRDEVTGAAGVTHRVPWNQQALGLLKKVS